MYIVNINDYLEKYQQLFKQLTTRRRNYIKITFSLLAWSQINAIMSLRGCPQIMSFTRQ